MKLIKARGLVIKEFDANESDKRLLLLCKELGRVMVFARGAKRTKSPLMPSAQLFCYSDFMLLDGRSFYSVTQADVLRSFYGLRRDYDCLMAAHLLAEVCDKSTLAHQNLDGLMLLALRALSLLEKNACPPRQVEAVFLLLALNFHGLGPLADACADCGMPLAEMRAAGGGLRFSGGGLCCKSCCRQKKTRPVSDACLAAVGHVLSCDMPAAFRFEARADVLENLRDTALFLWKANNDFELVSAGGGR